MIGVVSAEWLKLRTVRSTYLLLAAAAVFVLLTAAWSANVAHIWDGRPAGGKIHTAASPEYLIMAPFEVCAAVLGTLGITAEYATGTIRAGLTVWPRRLTYLMAKVPVVAGAALAGALPGVLAAFLLGRLIVGDRPINGFRTPLGEAAPALVASALMLVVAALLALALGVIVRSAAGALAGALTLLLVLPGVAAHLPAPWDSRVGSVLPTGLPGEITRAPDAAGTLGPVPAAVLLAAYAVVPLAAAAAVFVRRDA